MNKRTIYLMIIGSFDFYYCGSNASSTFSDTVIGTLYEEERLCSLDYEINNSGHIVASGGGANTFARIYQHFPYQYNRCTLENTTYCSVLKPTKDIFNGLTYSHSAVIPSPIGWGASLWPETITCQ